jgi:hypothetical protein
MDLLGEDPEWVIEAARDEAAEQSDLGDEAVR